MSGLTHPPFPPEPHFVGSAYVPESVGSYTGDDDKVYRRQETQERKHEVPASTRDEALIHCTKPSGVPRQKKSYVPS